MIFLKVGLCTNCPEGTVGCCKANNYSACFSIAPEQLDLLNEQREALYGKPVINDHACSYHSSNGCLLPDHKGPLCIAYACNGIINELKHKRVDYDWQEVLYSLEDVIAGRASNEELMNEVKQLLLALS